MYSQDFYSRSPEGPENKDSILFLSSHTCIPSPLHFADDHTSRNSRHNLQDFLNRTKDSLDDTYVLCQLMVAAFCSSN